MSESVAIIGIGIVSPFGTSRDAFRDALLRGDSGVQPITRFDVSQRRTRVAASVTDFDPTRWMPPMKLRRLDRTATFAVASVAEAFDDAGIAASEKPDPRTGVVLGTYSAGGESSEDYLDSLHRGGASGAPALIFHSTVGNAAASLVAMERKLRGPNVTVSLKEASGLSAIATATDLLREGRADVIAGGGIDGVFPLFFAAHDRFAMMAPGSGSDASRRPFDRHRGGFIMGEGAYTLVMTRATPGSNERVYGEVIGVGVTAAAVPLHAWPTDPKPLLRAMGLALEDAGVPADAINVVFASANSTPQLDNVEAQSLATLFPTTTLVTSIKGAIGECGASGAAACAAAFLCGRSSLVPPIAGLVEPDDAARSLNLVTTATPLPGPLILVNSVGAGGTLVSVVLRVATRAM